MTLLITNHLSAFPVAKLLLSVFLFVAVICDIRWRRIPNWLVVLGLISGFCARAFELGGSGIGTAFLGALAGLSLLLPFYMISILGAGDVKLMAAAGSFLEPAQILVATVSGIILNGAIGILIIILAGDFNRTMRRYLAMLMTVLTLQPHYIAPEHGEAAGRKMPYAVGLCIAVAVVTFYPSFISMRLW